ncbi:MAG: hypothetical protein R2825_17880 [Saprospiraceae bacterium]
MVVLVEWVSDAELGIGGGQFFLYLVVNALVDDEATGGGTSLSTSANRSRTMRRSAPLPYRCWGDDDGIVTT